MTLPYENTTKAVKERSFYLRGPRDIVDQQVRALLDGTKTQMRVPVKILEALSTPSFYITGKLLSDLPTQPGVWLEVRHKAQDQDSYEGSSASWLIRPPYQPGDRIWLQESFAIVLHTAYAHSDGVQQTLKPDDPYEHEAAIYREGWCRRNRDFGWRAPMHMPRWASRADFEITGLRLERLQDISIVDALAEGLHKVPHRLDYAYAWRDDDIYGHGSVTGAYRNLWESIHGPESWNKNPWVLVVEFRRVEQ